jgi:hypothetical protein
VKFSKNVIYKKCAPKMIFFNEKKICKIWISFDVENWLWKLEIGTFGLLNLKSNYFKKQRSSSSFLLS